MVKGKTVFDEKTKTSSMLLDDFFGSKGANDLSKSEDDIKIPWTHGGFKCYFAIKRLFSSPRPRKELNLLDQVETLLNTTPAEQEPTDELIDKCHHFIKLHRIVENTNARKRLEKWAKRVIVIYLLFVLCVVIINSLRWILISDAVMITILSTTTVNIIGLGLIVLRGHFPQDKSELKEDEGDKKRKDGPARK